MKTSINIEASVVQVFSEKIRVDYSRPWSTLEKRRGVGSGFCVSVPGISAKDQLYIMTNAHCVNEATHIALLRRNASKRFMATIKALSYECDLALLEVADDNFWKGMHPLKIGRMPNKLDKLWVYGYPLGGYNISATKGAVNRARIVPYFNVTQGVMLQIDAPVNFGNSGGPAVDIKGRVVGIASYGEDDSRTQNMGYIIPTIIIEYFIRNVKKFGKYPGICSLGVDVQPTTNSTLREYCKMNPSMTGVLITNINPVGSSKGVIREGDILSKFDGVPIANDGTISLRDTIATGLRGKQDDLDKFAATFTMEERVPLNTMVTLKLPGEPVEVELIRAGKVVVKKIKMKLQNYLAPILPYQLRPSYYIVAGLVFIPLSAMAVEVKLQRDEYVHHLIEMAESEEPKHPDDQVIVLSEILYTELTDGYYEENFVLEAVNGTSIRNMRHLKTIVERESSKNKYVQFTFADTPRVIILKGRDIKKYSTSIIMDQLGISETFSD